MYGRRSLFCILFAAFMGTSFVICWAEEPATLESSATPDGDVQAVEQRLRKTAEYLASDALEGRGIGGKGLDAAADYVADQFKMCKLKTNAYDGGPFQTFRMPVDAKLGKTNTLTIIRSLPDNATDSKNLELGEQFTPLAIGGAGTLTNVPLVFAGYGITAPDLKYDDYEGLDVKGKAVIVLRHEPDQANPHSGFNGVEPSEHAPFVRKISNAFEHGAAAVLFVTDQFEIDKGIADKRRRLATAEEQLEQEKKRFAAIEAPDGTALEQHQKKLAELSKLVERFSAPRQGDEDSVLSFQTAGTFSEGRTLPVFSVLRASVDPIISEATGKTLVELEKQIDQGPTPHSQLLKAAKMEAEVTIDRREAAVKNVVAVLDGEGPHADETIVIGAHYDHLGRTGSGRMKQENSEIHNGADDNASGTAVLIETARRLSARAGKPARRIVFIAFTGEEEGLIGSARYVRDPLYPLANTVAMINLDMVGRLTDDKLVAYGTGTSSSFDALVDRLTKQFNFKVTKDASGFGPSDHSSFYAKKIPVLFYFTGSHADYHQPTDDADKLNYDGMRRVVDLTVATADALAAMPRRPEYLAVKASAFGGGGDRPYFGSIPDFSQDKPGYALSGVAKDGPAERAGLQAGDIIVQFGKSKIGNLADFDSALRKYKSGDVVPVTVLRGAESVTKEVTLDPPR